MDEELFKRLALAFEKASDYIYEFTVGRKNSKSFIITSVSADEFTHICGIDHLPDIKASINHNTKNKVSLFKKMKRGDYRVSDLTSTDSSALQSSLPSTYNAATQSEYTIEQRLNALMNINVILDNAYKGAIYKWDKFKSNGASIQLPNGKYRRTKIGADYLIAIPSEAKGETIYCFAFQINKEKKNEPIKLNIHSIFADCVDLTKGQERPYTILQETKIHVKTKVSEQLYIHPSYQKELESAKEQAIATTQNVSTPTTSNIMKYEPKPLPNISRGGAAVISVQPPKLPDLWTSIKSKLKSLFRAEEPVRLPVKKATSRPKTQTKAVTTQKPKEVKPPEQPNHRPNFFPNGIKVRAVFFYSFLSFSTSLRKSITISRGSSFSCFNRLFCTA